MLEFSTFEIVISSSSSRVGSSNGAARCAPVAAAWPTASARGASPLGGAELQLAELGHAPDDTFGQVSPQVGCLAEQALPFRCHDLRLPRLLLLLPPLPRLLRLLHRRQASKGHSDAFKSAHQIV